MKKKVYFHIGWPKTGTSFLQKILFSPQNSDTFKRNNLLPIKGIYSHLPLEEMNFIKEKSAAEIKDRLDQKLALMPEAAGYIFSQESMITLTPPEIQKLATVFSRYDTQIIIYLRRQDEICESSWKQWYIKSMSFPEYLDHYMKNPTSYTQKLADWEDVFGKQNLTVRSYEKSQLTDGLQGDFFPLLGIDPSELFIAQSSVNTGFDRETLEILYHSRANLTDLHDNRLTHIFSRYQGQKKEFQKYDLLSVGERKALLALHQEENEHLARTYQSREGGLFSMAVDESKNSSFTGLDLEKSISFLTKVILDQHETIQNLKKEKQHVPLMGFRDILKALKRRLTHKSGS